MKTYQYRGSYSESARRQIIAATLDIGESLRISIESFGGQVIACFIVNGEDPIGFVEFPDDTAANAWVAHYAAKDGVKFAKITPVTRTNEYVASLRIAKEKAGISGNGHGW